MQMRLLNAYAGYLHAHILGRSQAYMAFIQDGTALAYYSDGMRIWEIADFTAEDWHSSDGYELMLQSMRDGWMMGQDDKPLFWVPVEQMEHLYVPLFDISTIMDFSNSRFGKMWAECIDRGL